MDMLQKTSRHQHFGTNYFKNLYWKEMLLDLMPSGFFLWAYLKSVFSKRQSTSLGKIINKPNHSEADSTTNTSFINFYRRWNLIVCGNHQVDATLTPVRHWTPIVNTFTISPSISTALISIYTILSLLPEF